MGGLFAPPHFALTITVARVTRMARDQASTSGIEKGELIAATITLGTVINEGSQRDLLSGNECAREL